MLIKITDLLNNIIFIILTNKLFLNLYFIVTIDDGLTRNLSIPNLVTILYVNYLINDSSSQNGVLDNPLNTFIN